jgi:hypothetical protein
MLDYGVEDVGLITSDVCLPTAARGDFLLG